MNDLFGEKMPESSGATVKAWCKCGTECDCLIKVHSDGTRHAWGTCPKCGLKSAKSQRLAPSLEDLRHRLMSIKVMILAMKPGVDQDEAIAMVERLCVELAEDTAQ